MCTRFVYNGDDMITGFNFDIDLAVWNHKVIQENDRFYIGIKQPDGIYHSYHGVNKNGNTGTLLYVHGNSAGAYLDSPSCPTIADLTEQYIKAQISLDEALHIVRTEKIVYAPDAFSVLHSVRQEGIWATRVSFVYSKKRKTIYYVQNNHFEQVTEYKFSL